MLMKKKSYIAIAAGRSGGHLIPGITIAQQYCEKHPETSIIIFCTHHAFDKKLISEHHKDALCIRLTLDNIPARWYLYPFFLFQLICSFFKSLYYLIKLRPEKVIVMGGYISIAVCLAAFITRVKRELYELNAVPGKATKVLAPFATTIYVCFQEAVAYFPAHKTIVTPYPIRFKTYSRTQEELCIDKSRTVLLILGGSQGSVKLNKIIAQYLEECDTMHQNLFIIHQTGHQDTTDWTSFYAKKSIPAFVFDYTNDLSRFYQAAHIIIARAGAGTAFEAAAYKKKTILIPLEIPGNNHQLYNGMALAKEYPELFKVIRQQELTISREPLAQEIRNYFNPVLK